MQGCRYILIHKKTDIFKTKQKTDIEKFIGAVLAQRNSVGRRDPTAHCLDVVRFSR